MKRFLSIDDSQIFTNWMSMILKPYGETFTANDGELGFELYKKELAIDSFDVIFLDLNLPGIDGEEMIKRIRGYEEHNKVLHKSLIFMVTANTDPIQMMKLLEKGADFYLSKPVDQQRFFEALERFKVIDYRIS